MRRDEREGGLVLPHQKLKISGQKEEAGEACVRLPAYSFCVLGHVTEGALRPVAERGSTWIK